MRFRRAVACGLAAVLGFAWLTASAAKGDTIIPVPRISYLDQTLVDEGAGYIFQTGEVGTDRTGVIVVSDLSGNYVTTLGAGDNVRGIAVNGGTLYAALYDKAAVDAIDIATITQPAPKETLYPLGTNNAEPVSLALQSGKLWVSYHARTGPAIGDIDLNGANPTFTANALPAATWATIPMLAADPDNDGFLAATDPGVDPPYLATYYVADGESYQFYQRMLTCGNGAGGLSVEPGGSAVLVYCTGAGIPAYAMTTPDQVTPAISFPNDAEAGGLAVAPDGTIAVGAGGGNAPATSTWIGTFAPDGSTLHMYQYSAAQDGTPFPLGWSPDSKRLYVVFVKQDISDNPTYVLHVLDITPRLTLSLTGTSSATFGAPVRLSGKVVTGFVTPPAGTPVTITRTLRGSASVTRFTVSTTASGAFAFTDATRPLPGRYSYTASVNGGTTPAATHTVTINPVPSHVAMALRRYYATVRHGSITYLLYRHTSRVTAHVLVTPKRRGECVRLQLQVHRQGKWRAALTTPCAALNGTSEVTRFLAASKEARGYPYRVRALFVPRHDTTIRAAESGWRYFIVRN